MEMASKSDLKDEINENKEAIKKLSERQTLIEEKEKEVAKQFIIMISTALALVSALFWQTAINNTIKTFLPMSGLWNYDLAIAFIITLLSAMIIVTLHQKQ